MQGGRSDEGDAEITLDTQLCFALYANANKIGRLYRSELEPFGLTFPQYLVLIVLWERAPCSVTDISHALELESNTITPLLKRLQVLGYLTRSRDLSDERRVKVDLTQRGRAFRDQAVAIRAAIIDRVGIPSDDILELRTMLQHLSKIMSLTLAAGSDERAPVDGAGLPAAPSGNGA